MQDLKQKLSLLLTSQVTDRTIVDYKKLISFIDTIITQSNNKQEEEKISFLITGILSIRDFMQSEVISKAVMIDAKSKVLQVYDGHFIANEEKEEIKKKEEGSKEEPQPLENL